MAGSPFPNIRPGDRAIPAKTCDMPPPTGQPVAAVWHRAAFHERVHSAGAEAGRPSQVPAGVSRQREVTWREASPNASHIDRRVRDGPEFADGWDRPERRTYDSRCSTNI